MQPGLLSRDPCRQLARPPDAQRPQVVEAGSRDHLDLIAGHVAEPESATAARRQAGKPGSRGDFVDQRCGRWAHDPRSAGREQPVPDRPERHEGREHEGACAATTRPPEERSGQRDDRDRDDGVQQVEAVSRA